tara:strand:+ start:3512 stop:5449 length:1938 start_codon:yes stop_codon:yes gene_type:complete
VKYSGFLLILLLFVTITFRLSAQLDLDSLWTIVNETKSDSIKAIAYTQIGNELAYINPDSGIAIAKISLAFSKSRGFSYRESKSYQFLALCYHVKGQLDSARKYYFKALPVQLLRDSLGVAGLYNNIGVSYNQEGNYPKSLEFYQKSLDLKLALGQIEASAKTTNNIGIIYFDQKQYSKALEYYNQALELEKQAKDESGMARTLGNIGLVYLEQKMFEQALSHYKKAYVLVESIGLNCRTIYTTNGVGQAFSKLGKLDSAKYYLNKALDDAKECQDPQIQTSTLLELGVIANQEGNISKAESYLLQSYQIAHESNFTPHFRSASEELYKFYKEHSQPEKSLKYLETAYALRDSLYNEDLITQLTTMELEYAFQKERDSVEYARITERLSYDSKIERQNLIQWITIIGLILALIIIFVVYRYYRLKNLANQELTIKNHQITESLAEREVLLQEVHHRVKNNLQVVSSLLHIQSKFLIDEGAKRAVLEGRDRVLSMAFVHQRLYESKNLSRVDIREYLGQLADMLVSTYQVEHDIELVKEIEDLDLDLDTSIHLGLIVNELISNSLKHAFHEIENGIVTVKLKDITDNYQLSVSDNGKGLEDESELLKSYGFRIIKSLVRGLKAELSIETVGGTTIIINFKKPSFQP